jgi:hypothetical protein
MVATLFVAQCGPVDTASTGRTRTAPSSSQGSTVVSHSSARAKSHGFAGLLNRQTSVAHCAQAASLQCQETDRQTGREPRLSFRV